MSSLESGTNVRFTCDNFSLQNRIGRTIVLQYRYRLKQVQVFDLTINISMKASKLSLEHKTPMADGSILAAGRPHQAIVWTQDKESVQ